ncbi:ABC transporter permease [Aureimonas sp. Leaf454]|uniref:phosphate ABC transporter permease subunit PstC n=1 Tax=Aureimonas sp. Leaf454 TaxID=1736381 RepID=UPI0006F76A92|nr:phosphate ABC transporter permease subunit PstC [Aureimonas sp. Leaf454]KQT54946.1 ABC transporter permease [Aureimonas sp. Leaf454]
MSIPALVAIVLLIGLAAAYMAAAKSRRLAVPAGQKMHSRPAYHGSYVFSWAVLPALAVLAVSLIATPIVISRNVAASMPNPGEVGQTVLARSMIAAIGQGLRILPDEERAAANTLPVAELRPLLQRRGVAIASATEDYMVAIAVEQNRQEDLARLVTILVVLALSVAGAVFGLSQIAVRLRARNRVEGVVKTMLVVASSVAILTTIGIVSSMLFETVDFFSRVPASSFFFGTVWDPRFSGGAGGEGQFGLIPLLAGTLYIAFVAMLVAVPIGLFAAIYMAEYANGVVRSFVKPMLEVLAGIPTIVYGFFALVTVGPFLRDLSASLNGIVTGDYASFIQGQSVLTAGLVMGIMLIPFVSSLSDDIITSVPGTLRDGSLGLGATRSETIKRVILPAALPGIVSALLLTASRAIGETMIVVLAAGVAPNLTANPFEAMTTVTVKIVNQLTGDLEFNSPQTLVAFALGLTLFAITLCLNIFALYIVRKYREQYE